MTMETILEHEYGTLWYYPDKKIVHYKFNKFTFGQQFRSILTKGMEIIEEQGCEKLLSDDSAFSAVHPDDSEWATSVFGSRIEKAGLKYWALVLPKSQLGKASFRNSVNHASGNIVEVKTFSDPDEAFNWLENR